MVDNVFQQAYEGVLPSCPCFVRREGEPDIPEDAQGVLQMTVGMSQQVAQHLLDSNVCPTAIPIMLAVMASSVLVFATGARSAATDPLEMLPETRAAFDRFMAAMPLEIARIERLTLATGRTAGSC